MDKRHVNTSAVLFSWVALPVLVVSQMLAAGVGFGLFSPTQSHRWSSFVVSCMVSIVSAIMVFYYTKRCDSLPSLVSLTALSIVVVYAIVCGPIVFLVSEFWKS